LEIQASKPQRHQARLRGGGAGIKRLLLLTLFVGACLIARSLWGCSATSTATITGGSEATSAATGDAGLAQAFADHAEGRELEGQGTVSRLLADDTEGDRHQRFIVRLASGQTLVVTHNIDVAPRVTSL
jgi:hypothetical protein